MISKKVKIISLLIIFFLSITITSFFIIKTSLKVHNLDSLVNDYDITVVPVTDEQENLNPDIVFSSINKKEINKSIDIKLRSNSSENQLILFYQPQYNNKLFEFLFLKQIIKTFPQWEVNYFIFSYNSLNQAVWVKYATNKNQDYLNWFFEIISKV